MSSIAVMELEERAKSAAGNWRKFDSFVWWRTRELERPEDFTVYYTHHRDSGLLDQSNHAAISKEMKNYTDGDNPDVIEEDHSHWAVGWIKGFAVRVFDENGEITDAYRCLHELQERMGNYPIIDESHYSEMEYEASFENIDLAAWRLKREFALPDDWQSSAFDWLWQHRDNALENVDDQGGWPDEEDLEAAFGALGYARAA